MERKFRRSRRYGFMGKGAGVMPEVNGMAGYYAGFCIFEDAIGIREWDETDDRFFGLTTTERFAMTAVDRHATEVTAGTRVYNSIVFGNSAIGKGVASDLSFTDEVDDHKNTVEVGGALINGYNRADFFSETNASESGGYAFEKANAAEAPADSALACTNQSSLILATQEGA